MVDVQMLREYRLWQARTSFFEFRKIIRPEKYKFTWLHEYLSNELQQFYVDYTEGRRPKLLISMPPQHGKSDVVNDFVLWFAGKHPDKRTIFASFAEALGVRANKYLQNTMALPSYRAIFPDTALNSSSVVTQAAHSEKNSSTLEYVGQAGSFRNTTVKGSITGLGLDLGIIDDPIKGRKEANSATERESTWSWYTDDFKTRFAEDAGFLMVMTRWHVDDPAGRLIERDSELKVISLTAIAEQDEEFRKAGEALFPEHKSLEFLLEQKATMAPASWESLYQQKPVISGGNLFKDEWFIWQHLQATPSLAYRFIVADTAMKTNKTSDYSVFQCWGFSNQTNKLYLLDMVREKLEYPDLIQTAQMFIAKHKGIGGSPLRGVHIEDKSSGTSLIQDLKRVGGLPVVPIARNGRSSKEDRAFDVLGYISAGNCVLPLDQPWSLDLKTELISFPSGVNDDQVDALVDALAIAYTKRPVAPPRIQIRGQR